MANFAKTPALQGSISPTSEKEGFGVEKPHFHQPGKGRFEPEIPIFSTERVGDGVGVSRPRNPLFRFWGFLGNGRNTVSRVLFRRRELTEPHWVLGQTQWVLRRTRWVRVYTQIIGCKELTEFAFRNSVSPDKLTEFGVWSRAPRNRIRPVSEFWPLYVRERPPGWFPFVLIHSGSNSKRICNCYDLKIISPIVFVFYAAPL